MGKRFVWTPEKAEILIQNYGKIEDYKIAKIVGCIDVRSIPKKAMEVGIWKKKYISSDDELFIVENHGKLTAKELAETFNKTTGAITHIWRKHGIIKKTFEWTNEKVELLKECYSYKTREEILECLEADNWDIISNKADSLKLKRREFLLLKKDELLDYLISLSEELGRTPTIYDLKEISVSPLIKNFGSYANACEAAGLSPNKSERDGAISSVIYSKNGDRCFSASEMVITNFFIDNNVQYEKEVYYTKLSNDKRFGKMRCDWVINKYIAIEFFGVNDSDYRKRSDLKIRLCKKNNVPLIPIYPSEITQKKLIDKFYFLLNNP